MRHANQWRAVDWAGEHIGYIATPWAFVVACDMPFVSPELVEQLATYRGGSTSRRAGMQGYLQPMAAFYSVSCIPVMRATLSLGDKSLSGAIRNLDVSYVDESAVAAFRCGFTQLYRSGYATRLGVGSGKNGIADGISFFNCRSAVHFATHGRLWEWSSSAGAIIRARVG